MRTPKPIVNVNVEEMVNILNDVEHSTPIFVMMETSVRMNKTGNPFYNKIIKETTGRYFIGNDYENRVNNNMEREGMDRSFETEQPKGKHHISKCVLKDDKTDSVYYLMMERFKEVKPKVRYFFEGNVIEKQLFESYMTKVYEPTKQEQERKVYPMTPKIENIRFISLNGIRYVIEKEEVFVND
jgi:hypothetical protein